MRLARTIGAEGGTGAPGIRLAGSRQRTGSRNEKRAGTRKRSLLKVPAGGWPARAPGCYQDRAG